MDRDHVRQVRSFNRTVTQRVGALTDDFLDRGRPLGASRLLYEIGRDGAEVRELRAHLDLDSGYVSRLLRALERQGLVRGDASPRDARVRRVTLTPKGRREVAELDRRSDAFATSVLAPLSAAQRQSLTAAMAEVERLMRASAIRIESEAAGIADALWCLAEYFSELATRFEAGFDPARSISASAEELTPPAGVFVVARLGGRPVGCGGRQRAVDHEPRRAGRRPSAARAVRHRARRQRASAVRFAADRAHLDLAHGRRGSFRSRWKTLHFGRR